jgi:hypothetical protein
MEFDDDVADHGSRNIMFMRQEVVFKGPMDENVFWEMMRSNWHRSLDGLAHAAADYKIFDENANACSLFIDIALAITEYLDCDDDDDGNNIMANIEQINPFRSVVDTVSFETLYRTDPTPLVTARYDVSTNVLRLTHPTECGPLPDELWKFHIVDPVGFTGLSALIVNNVDCTDSLLRKENVYARTIYRAWLVSEPSWEIMSMRTKNGWTRTETLHKTKRCSLISYGSYGPYLKVFASDFGQMKDIEIGEYLWQHGIIDKRTSGIEIIGENGSRYRDYSRSGASAEWSQRVWNTPSLSQTRKNHLIDANCLEPFFARTFGAFFLPREKIKMRWCEETSSVVVETFVAFDESLCDENGRSALDLVMKRVSKNIKTGFLMQIVHPRKWTSCMSIYGRVPSLLSVLQKHGNPNDPEELVSFVVVCRDAEKSPTTQFFQWVVEEKLEGLTKGPLHIVWGNNGSSSSAKKQIAVPATTVTRTTATGGQSTVFLFPKDDNNNDDNDDDDENDGNNDKMPLMMVTKTPKTADTILGYKVALIDGKTDDDDDNNNGKKNCVPVIVTLEIESMHFWFMTLPKTNVVCEGHVLSESIVLIQIVRICGCLFHVPIANMTRTIFTKSAVLCLQSMELLMQIR